MWRIVDIVEKILQFLNSKQDKVMHFSGGYILCTLFPIHPYYGLFLAFSVGKLKEIYDFKNADKHTCDKWDMFATWLGALLGFISLLFKGGY